MIEALELRTDAAMHAQYFLIDEGADWHDIEYVRECFPELDVVFAFAFVELKITFVVEAVDPVDA